MLFKNIALDVFLCMNAYNKPKCLVFIHVYDQVNKKVNSLKFLLIPEIPIESFQI